MKKLLIIITIAFATKMNAQQTQGTIIYETKIMEGFKIANAEQKNASKKEISNLDTLDNNNWKTFQFALYFNNNKALYKSITKVNSNSIIDEIKKEVKRNIYTDSSNQISIDNLIFDISGGRDEFYFDFDKKMALHKMGKSIINKEEAVITNSKTLQDTHWLKKDSSKTILGHVCKLAYQVKMVHTDPFGYEPPKEEITYAWYSTQLPARLGISHYVDLPGTVLEVIEPHRTITAVEIKSTVNDNDIAIPSGKQYTQEEYWAINDKEVKEKIKNSKDPRAYSLEKWQEPTLEQLKQQGYSKEMIEKIKKQRANK